MGLMKYTDWKSISLVGEQEKMAAPTWPVQWSVSGEICSNIISCRLGRAVISWFDHCPQLSVKSNRARAHLLDESALPAWREIHRGTSPTNGWVNLFTTKDLLLDESALPAWREIHRGTSPGTNGWVNLFTTKDLLLDESALPAWREIHRGTSPGHQWVS